MHRSFSIVFAFTIFWSYQACAEEDVCGERWNKGGTVFSLSIDRSFHPGVIFKLCERQPPEQSFLLVSIQPPKKDKRWKSTRMPLDAASYERFVSLYETALEYDVKYPSMGLDGSSWCIETRRQFTYSKACFWTPGHEAHVRRLEGLFTLGQELWRQAALNPKELY